VGIDKKRGGWGINNMELGSQWYNKIATEISQYKITLGEKGAAKYRLDLLLRVAKRVDEFSDICAECQAYKQEVTGLVKEMSLLIQMPSKEGMKKHNKAVSVMVEHLKKTHKLVDKGHYMGMGIGIGLAIGGGLGAALGAALDNPGIGTGIGVALGVAIGAYLDNKAKQEGRVI
jgi:hypothetical protein